MKLEHLAIWTTNLEAMTAFYEKYFKVKAGSPYHNPNKKFKLYFLNFETGCQLELMTKAGIDESPTKEQLGLAHFAISVGSKEGY